MMGPPMPIRVGTKVEFRTIVNDRGSTLFTCEPGFHTTVHRGKVIKMYKSRHGVVYSVKCKDTKLWMVESEYIRRLPRGLTVSG